MREGIIAPIIPDRNGLLHPFRHPGLVFEIDPKLLRKYSKRCFKIAERDLNFKVIRGKGLKAVLDLKRRKESAA